MQQQKQQEQAAPPKWKQMETEGHHCPLGKRNARKEECEDAVKAATGVHPALPDRMAGLFDRDEKFATLPNDISAVQDFVRKTTGARA